MTATKKKGKMKKVAKTAHLKEILTHMLAMTIKERLPAFILKKSVPRYMWSLKFDNLTF